MKSIREMIDTVKALDFIYETPVRYPSPKITPTKNGTIAVDSLNTRFKKIGESNFKGFGHLTVFVADTDAFAIGVPTDELNSGQERVDQVFRLVFKDEPTFSAAKQFSNSKQVKWVKVDPAHQNDDISSTIYTMLARSGYAIISDLTQYEPGVKLWKRLARDLGVLVVDVTRGVLTNGGQPIIYDGNNIPNKDIWSTAPDRSKEDIVLVLTPERARRA